MKAVTNQKNPGIEDFLTGRNNYLEAIEKLTKNIEFIERMKSDLMKIYEENKLSNELILKYQQVLIQEQDLIDKKHDQLVELTRSLSEIEYEIAKIDKTVL